MKDLWNLKAQFFAVFIMAMLGVLIYTGIEGVWYGRLNYADKLFEETNLSDLWVTGTNLEEKDIEKVNNIEAVKNTQASYMYTANMELSNDTQEILLIAQNKNEISKPVVIEGEEYNPTGDGLWLYGDYAKEHNIKLGDIIELFNEGKKLSIKVKGIVLSPEYLSYMGSKNSIKPDHFKYGYGFISKDNLEKLSDNKIYYQQIKVKTDNDKNLERDLKDKLGEKYITQFNRTNFIGVSPYIDKFNQIKNMSILFSIVFILLCILTIQTTMRRMIETQRIQIGTLKALGYRNRTIKIHYMLYGLFVSLFGGSIGYVIAPLTISKILINAQKAYYSVPNWDVKISTASIILVMLITIICTYSAFYASYKDCNEMPSNIMRGKSPKSRKSFLLESFLKVFKNVSSEWRWALRDSIRYKSRTIIGVIGVAGSLMLLMASFGVRETLINANNVLYGEQLDYGSKVVLNTLLDDEKKEELLNKTGDDGQWVQESSMELRTSNSKKNSIASIIDKGYFYHFEDRDGNNISLPDNGVVVSKKLAEELNISINDIVEFKVNGVGEGEYKKVLVKNISTTLSPQGLYISKNSFESIGEEFNPNVLLVKEKEVGSETKNLSYVNEVVTLQDKLEEMDEVIGGVLIIVIMLLAAAILLSIVILSNLGILGFVERAREYATLKVIGYHKKELYSIIKRDVSIQVVLGAFIGIPLGYEFLGFYIKSISTSDFEYRPYISLLSILTSLLIIIVCSYLVVLIIYRKVKNINMVEALKYVE